MRYSLSSISGKKMENLGVIFSNSNPGANYNYSGGILPYTSGQQDATFSPTQVSNISSTNWTHLTTTFTAPNSLLSFISIGRLLSDNLSGLQNTPIAYFNNHSDNNHRAYYFIDNISIIAVPPSCTLNNVTTSCGTPVTLVATNPDMVASFQWYDSDGDIISGATSASLTVNPISTTVYNLKVTNYAGCEETYQATVFVTGQTFNDNIEPPEINQHAIYGGGMSSPNSFNYEVENPDPNSNYLWEFVSGNGYFTSNGNGPANTGTSVIFTWTSSASSNYLGKIKLTRYLNNCSYSSTIYTVSNQENFNCISNFQKQIEWDINNQNDIDNISNNIWYLEGVTTIKANVSFNGKIIYMAPNAKIRIDPGYTLTINNTTIQGCLAMWDGIFANSNTENIIISNSSFSDAVYGVISKYGGNLTLTNDDFFDNLYDVQLINNKSQSLPIPPPAFTPASITIYGSNFGNSSNALSLKKPYLNNQTIANINIKKMEDVQIGNAAQTSNTFYNSIHGITIYNSKVKIINNAFNDIVNQMYPSPDMEKGAIAINSISTYNMENIGNVTIGGITITDGNEFNNCYHSINSNNCKVSISNNIFSGGHQSIDIYNFMNGTEVLNNTFKDIYFGVRVNNLLGVNRKILVKDNYFGGQTENSYTSISREAINLINCSSQINSSIKSQIANNTIKFTGQKTYLTSGIRIQNCTGIMVNSNFIARGVTSPSILNSDWDKTIGIRVAKCAGAQITDNYIYGFGKSVTTYGNLTGTQFSCNEFIIYKYGFYWDMFTALSNQGVAGVNNNHDKWATLSSISGNQKLADITVSTGNIINNSNILWYYYSSDPAQYIPNSFTFGVHNLIPTLNTTDDILCVGGSGSGGNGGSGTSTGGGSSTNSTSPVLSLLDDIEDPEQRDFLLQDILDGEQYIELENEYRAYDAEFLYNMLAEDTTMMFLGGDRDSDYQDFFDSIQQANIGEFYDVYRLIEAGEYAEAASLNSSIIPEQDIYLNLKTVLGIYLNTWCIGRYELTVEEYETLYDIATLTPYEGGVGVYTARIMIGFEPDNNGVAYRLEKPSNENASFENFTLYPNPASNEITIEFKNEKFDDIDAMVKVCTLTGKLIYKTSFSTNHSFKVLPVNMLENGVYLYNIKLSNGIEGNGKLIILK